MSHTKEPWSSKQNGVVDSHIESIVCDLSGIHVAGVFCAEDARRIVACVNACQGISTKTLEHANAHRKKLNGINTAYEIAAGERDTCREMCGELLKTLRITESWLEGWASAENELSITKSAIIKAEAILGEKK